MELLLSVPRPPCLPSLQVAMSFQASPQASAVQWLEPEQTAGKKHPYLFTQVSRGRQLSVEALRVRWPCVAAAGRGAGSC